MVGCAKLIVLLMFATLLGAADTYLFTSFRSNGETGVFFATSQDGRKWEPLNGNRAWIEPQHPGMLMRDPYLVRGPDGVWHLIWTWGWTRKEGGGRLRIGHTSSRDLIQWTPQQEIPVFDNEPGARNAWAPEAVWDQAKSEWVIFWSTTIPGRFPGDDPKSENGYNHRVYAMTTRDWKTFSAPRLWFDPGFNCIDSTLVKNGDRWIMVFKDERREPLRKNLRLAFSNSPQGPWSGVTEPFTPSWVEGPSVARIGSEWWIYFDHYQKPRHYGAMRTRDWKNFENMTDQVSFPEDHRHGTVVQIMEADARRLRARSGTSAASGPGSSIFEAILLTIDVSADEEVPGRAHAGQSGDRSGSGERSGRFHRRAE